MDRPMMRLEPSVMPCSCRLSATKMWRAAPATRFIKQPGMNSRAVAACDACDCAMGSTRTYAIMKATKTAQLRVNSSSFARPTLPDSLHSSNLVKPKFLACSTSGWKTMPVVRYGPRPSDASDMGSSHLPCSIDVPNFPLASDCPAAFASWPTSTPGMGMKHNIRRNSTKATVTRQRRSNSLRKSLDINRCSQDWFLSSSDSVQASPALAAA
mmetsp:Transcript_6131/g.17589  ORF Transcript_6131/g.17589 Transcript_6131/m.17589 type:complete len:212 (-) Transcript_6131:37-672(-)